MISSGATTFSEAATYQMKLAVPKKLKAGKYQLKLSYTADGAKTAQNKTLGVKVLKAKKGKKKGKAVVVRGDGGAPTGIHATKKQPKPKR